MDAALATLRAQRGVVAVAIVLSAVLVNVGDADIFTLPKVTALYLAALVIVFLAVVRWAWMREAAVPAEPAALAVMAFVVAMAVTTLTSSTPMQSVIGQYTHNAGLATYAASAVLFAGVLRANKAQYVPGIVRAFVVAATVVTLYGLVQVAGIDPVDWSREDQVFSTLGNPNFLAGWLGAMFPLCIWAALRRQAVGWRIAGAAAAPCIVVLAVASDSFQGPVTVAASGAAFVLLAGALPRRLLVGGAVLAGLALVVLGPRIADELDDGLLERRHFWSVAMEVGTDHPVVGTGPDTFHNEFLSRRPAAHAAIPASRNAGAAHDVPLHLFAGGGLLLIVPYLAFVALVGVRLLTALPRLAGDERVLLAAVGAAWFGYQVQSLVSIDKPTHVVAHFVLAGAVLLASGPLRWREVRLPGHEGRGDDVGSVSTWIVTGAAALLLLVGGWFAFQPQRADFAYESGIRSAEAGDGATAIDDLELARDLAPWESRYTFDLARIRLLLGDADGAIDEAEAGARLEPGDSSYAAFAGQLAARVGRDDLATAWYEEALRRDPYGTEILGAAAANAARTGDRARAEELVDRLLDVTDERADVWADVYAVRVILEDESGAAEAERRARELNPSIELDTATPAG